MDNSDEITVEISKGINVNIVRHMVSELKDSKNKMYFSRLNSVLLLLIISISLAYAFQIYLRVSILNHFLVSYQVIKLV